MLSSAALAQTGTTDRQRRRGSVVGGGEAGREREEEPD